MLLCIIFAIAKIRIRQKMSLKKHQSYPEVHRMQLQIINAVVLNSSETLNKTDLQLFEGETSDPAALRHDFASAF